MKNNKNIPFLTLFMIASFLLLSSCNTQLDLQSKWRDRDIVIDGKDNEWQGCRLYNDGITGTHIGIYNDNDYMYIYFSTMDPEIQEAMVRQGFFIWFDETGGKNKALGIRYPIGGQPRDQGVREDPKDGGPGGIAYSVEELQIMTSVEDTGKTLKVSEAAGLEINVRIATEQSGKLIYELRMPLKKTDKTPYAVVPSQINRIGVGVMTAKVAGGTLSGKSGFGGSISDIGANTGAASDSVHGSDVGSIMPNRYIDNDDPRLGKVTIVSGAQKTTEGKSIEIWANILMASEPQDIK